MKLNDNVYVIIFLNVGISYTFNVEYLVNYKILDATPFVDEPTSLFVRASSFHRYQIFYPKHVKLINS